MGATIEPVLGANLALGDLQNFLVSLTVRDTGLDPGHCLYLSCVSGRRSAVLLT